uniref:phosphatidylinositol-specific phospholipase C/glycerophosphodiester phosphodiesterase family protein n=1 Tax=Mucilaginibacter sp. Bleaf8 TaxID=2834430 RepID=UPI0020BF4F9E|nr:phosphatidylinositol-specific phospholipase C/glycerophosphodiester phosphodiesterase family protein [Mucilaginibacter sp. Bleaf8]
MFFIKQSLGFSQSLPLANAFAHNDYWHKRPLYDALDNGYVHIEADVYLRGNNIIVAHILPVLKKKRTLEKLYLKPLQECIDGTGKRADCPSYPLTLLIDIKSDAEKTYRELDILLQKYKAILSSVEQGHYTQRQVTIVISGHKPFQLLKSQSTRFAFIDEDLKKVDQDTTAKNFYQTASCKYSSLIRWKGQGSFPEIEKQRLCQYVSMAHRFGKKVRLWSSPENPAVWNALLQCGVDLINTDKLLELKNFLSRPGILSANVN